MIRAVRAADIKVGDFVAWVKGIGPVQVKQTIPLYDPNTRRTYIELRGSCGIIKIARADSWIGMNVPQYEVLAKYLKLKKRTDRSYKQRRN